MAPLLALPDPVLADEDVAPGLRVLVPAAMGVVDLGALAATGGPGGLYHRADAGRAGLFASAQELLHAPIVLRQGKERCEKTILFFSSCASLYQDSIRKSCGLGVNVGGHAEENDGEESERPHADFSYPIAFRGPKPIHLYTIFFVIFVKHL